MQARSASRVHVRGGHDVGGRDAGDLLDRLGRVGLHQLGHRVVAVGALADEVLVGQPVADDHVAEAVSRAALVPGRIGRWIWP